MIDAVCILVTNDDGNVLCVSRKDDHNAWGLPGGKLEDNELPIITAIRETAEETGHLVFVDINDYYDGKCGDYMVRTYRGRIETYNAYRTHVSETGLVEYRRPLDLIDGPFGVYNEYCLNYFNIKG